MINSRKISDLHPFVQDLCNKHVKACKDAGIDLLITSTYRDKQSQDALYAQGRTTPGKIVTKAKGGQSFHNFRVAYDVVPIINGKAIWNNGVLWGKVGAIGKSFGLEWGGDFKSIKDYPHFQYTGGLTLAQFNAGKQPNYA